MTIFFEAQRTQHQQTVNRGRGGRDKDKYLHVIDKKKYLNWRDKVKYLHGRDKEKYLHGRDKENDVE